MQIRWHEKGKVKHVVSKAKCVANGTERNEILQQQSEWVYEVE